MPLQLSIGFSKKQGLPDYGSLGASCNVTVEMDALLLREDLETFHKHVRHAYVACSQAVDDELARQADRIENHNDRESHPTSVADSSSTATNGHKATQKQLDYCHQLARQIQGLGVRRLESLAMKVHGKPLAGLSSLEASSLIDTLKAIKDGRVKLETALDGVTT